MRSCRLKEFGKPSLSDERRSFRWGEPSGFPLRLLWPFAKLPLHREQKYRYFVDSCLSRVAAFLVAVIANRFFADDSTEQAGFLICFAGSGGARREFPDGPALRNNPVAFSAGSDKQNPHLPLLGNRERKGATLITNYSVPSGHLCSGHPAAKRSFANSKHALPRRRNPLSPAINTLLSERPLFLT